VWDTQIGTTLLWRVGRGTAYLSQGP
jgi:hypothetical protein